MTATDHLLDHTATPWRRALASTVLVALVAASTAALSLLAPAPAAAAAEGPEWWPLKGTVELWCTWGNPSPYNNCTSYHPYVAMDIGVPQGTPVYASGGGRVVDVTTTCTAGDTSCSGGRGNFVAVTHPNGRTSRYLHLSSVAVAVGSTVVRGDLLGYSGWTGSTCGSTCQHLHFDVSDATYPNIRTVDPGPLSATVDGQTVSYPGALGFAGWNATPYGTRLRNDGYPPVVPPPPGAGPAGAFRPVTPFRVLDSRTDPGFGGPLVGGQGAKGVSVAGVGGVGTNAAAVVMNVTVTGGTAPSYLTVFPSGYAPPYTANIVFDPGQTVPNMVTARVGPNGQVAFFTPVGSVHVVADVVGWYDDGTSTGGSLFNGMQPARALDSRTTTGGWQSTKIGPGQSRPLAVAGAVPGVPSTAKGLVLTVTATDGTDATYIQVWPTGAPQPLTANLLVGARQTIANAVTVGVGAGGAISIFNQRGAVHVVVDVVGYYDATGARFRVLYPSRFLDSRTGTGGYTGAWGSDTWRTVQVATGSPVPATAVGVALNVTATGATVPTYLTAYPAGAGNPGTASLLTGPGPAAQTAVLSALGGGALVLYNQKGSVDVIADLAGYFSTT